MTRKSERGGSVGGKPTPGGVNEPVVDNAKPRTRQHGIPDSPDVPYREDAFAMSSSRPTTAASTSAKTSKLIEKLITAFKGSGRQVAQTSGENSIKDGRSENASSSKRSISARLWRPCRRSPGLHARDTEKVPAPRDSSPRESGQRKSTSNCTIKTVSQSLSASDCVALNTSSGVQEDAARQAQMTSTGDSWAAAAGAVGRERSKHMTMSFLETQLAAARRSAGATSGRGSLESADRKGVTYTSSNNIPNRLSHESDWDAVGEEAELFLAPTSDSSRAGVPILVVSSSWRGNIALASVHEDKTLDTSNTDASKPSSSGHPTPTEAMSETPPSAVSAATARHNWPAKKANSTADRVQAIHNQINAMTYQELLDPDSSGKLNGLRSTATPPGNSHVQWGISPQDNSGNVSLHSQRIPTGSRLTASELDGMEYVADSTVRSSGRGSTASGGYYHRSQDVSEYMLQDSCDTGEVPQPRVSSNERFADGIYGSEPSLLSGGASVMRRARVRSLGGLGIHRIVLGSRSFDVFKGTNIRMSEGAVLREPEVATASRPVPVMSHHRQRSRRLAAGLLLASAPTYAEGPGMLAQLAVALENGQLDNTVPGSSETSSSHQQHLNITQSLGPLETLSQFLDSRQQHQAVPAQAQPSEAGRTASRTGRRRSNLSGNSAFGPMAETLISSDQSRDDTYDGLLRTDGRFTMGQLQRMEAAYALGSPEASKLQQQRQHGSVRRRQPVRSSTSPSSAMRAAASSGRQLLADARTAQHADATPEHSQQPSPSGGVFGLAHGQVPTVHMSLAGASNANMVVTRSTTDGCASNTTFLGTSFSGPTMSSCFSASDSTALHLSQQHSGITASTPPPAPVRGPADGDTQCQQQQQHLFVYDPTDRTLLLMEASNGSPTNLVHVVGGAPQPMSGLPNFGYSPDTVPQPRTAGLGWSPETVLLVLSGLFILFNVCCLWLLFLLGIVTKLMVALAAGGPEGGAPEPAADRGVWAGLLTYASAWEGVPQQPS